MACIGKQGQAIGDQAADDFNNHENSYNNETEH